MLLPAGTHIYQGSGSIGEICSAIPAAYHTPILGSCGRIRTYLDQHVSIAELPAPVFEIVQLVFQKIEDELTHAFRKETGIVFPYLQQQMGDGKVLLQPKVLDTMLHTHQVLIELLQKLRQLVHHYVTHPAWPDALKGCINEMFLLETHVLRWIHFEQSVLYPLLNSYVTTKTA
ncbi:hemerythrin domain-containing protein [Sediminibacterium sp.]|uniref:hemerythrin domain-containing protein n=1 Tax=Sediminibacterium sp. TaxID=1917865 RepID=UPI0025E1AD69|nr:hemerythrin domain-containing protein [Sediminibacterium sp.]MBW0179099.1 hemerythrin domain-containing protein [Sediminibacterium sp.]